MQISEVSEFDNRVLLTNEDFLTPTSQIYLDEKKKFKLLDQLPERFPAKDYVVQQYFAKSKDGTAIPYFVIHKKMKNTMRKTQRS